MKFTLPDVAYSYASLEPMIDAMTMEIHYTKHHQAYVNNLNAALEKYPEFESKNLEELLTNLQTLPEDIRTIVRNNGGGHYNHSLFWEVMTPKFVLPEGELLEMINNTFGTLETLQQEFSKAALGRFGSGWVWLILNNNKLEIMSTPNQDNPLMEGKKPILGLDVWEHAYYLKYQNKRNEYIENWYKVINWLKVGELYATAKSN